jgi:hypothetical protein
MMPFVTKKVTAPVTIVDGFICDCCKGYFKNNDKYAVLQLRWGGTSEKSVFCEGCYEKIIGFTGAEPQEE